MKIVVCVKQVPATGEQRLDPVTGTVIREGVPSILNPFDAYALEEAVRLKERFGGEIVALSMGVPSAKETLRRALAVGADRAILLSGRAFAGADTLATAYTLSQAVRKLGAFDLLLFGQHSADGDTAQVGAAVAAFLDIPQVTLASSLECRDGWACCDRSLKNCVEKVRVKLPAAITVCAEINDPPYASPLGILAALEKPLTVWSAAELGADPARTGTPGSPSSTKRVFQPPRRGGAVEFFSGSAREAAAQFVDMLEAEHLI